MRKYKVTVTVSSSTKEHAIKQLTSGGFYCEVTTVRELHSWCDVCLDPLMEKALRGVKIKGDSFDFCSEECKQEYLNSLVSDSE